LRRSKKIKQKFSNVVVVVANNLKSSGQNRRKSSL